MFLNDLARGNYAQKLVSKIFIDCGFHTVNVDPKGPDRSFYDIASNGYSLDFTTEIKYDEYEDRSGNIAIETYNTRTCKPSGIGITKAFFWAHVLKQGGVYITQCDRLRSFMSANKPRRIIEAGGDGNAQLYLYSSDIILPAIFDRIDNIGKTEVLEIIKGYLNGS